MSTGTSESKAAGGGGFYFDEMELTLGLPGDSRGRISGMKRSFSDMVDLKLGSSENPEVDESGSECSGSESKKATSMDSRERISGTKCTYSDMVDLKLGSTENPEIDESDSECSRSESRKPTSTERVIELPEDSRERMFGTKQLYSDMVDLKLGSSENPEIDESDSECSGSESRKPASTDQVIGWPPVRSYRKNTTNNNCKYVKVAVDGAPYLRKVDLKSCTSYQQLLHVFENMFTCFKFNNVLDEKKVKDHVNRSEHVPTYEDKDGDWMLVGDVPWKMFVESCKRIRLMKSTEAIMQLVGVYNTMK